jgi:vanillin dehydrogenase
VNKWLDDMDSIEELGAVISTALKSEIDPPGEPGRVTYITREPFGVVFSISPWNAPFILALRAVASPIVAGNTVVLKTSEMSPLSNMIIAQLFLEAGLPPGVLNVIHTSAENAPKASKHECLFIWVFTIPADRLLKR